MARIVLLDGNGHEMRLDADAADACGDARRGYKNCLPGFHELRVRADGGEWIGAALVVRAGDTALLRFHDGRLEAAPDAAAPADDTLIDALARDPDRARAWQAATSELDAKSVRAIPNAPSPPRGVRELQASFVRAWLHGDADARGPLVAIARSWAHAGGDGCQSASVEATRLGQALAGMVQLFPELADELPIDPLVEALSRAGNELADGDLLAAANKLQLITRE